MTTRMLYDQELKLLDEDLVEMSRMVEQAIVKTFEALKNNDSAQAREIIKNDRAVDEMEHAIESRCLSLVLRQQPVARDLRHISTALKVVTDLERIGDHAADIAELTLHLNGAGDCKELKHLPAMVDSVKAMLRDAIDAFIEGDADKAAGIEVRDDIVDAFFDKVKAEVVELLKADSGEADSAVDLLMIAKYLERIADHAVNVCEWTEFADSGTLKNVPII